jgi:ABC-2 type transport system ATP-binding protein
VDPAGAHAIRDLILQCKQRGITVLLCSHLLGQVQEICDWIGIMDRGELLAEGRIDALVGKKNQLELVLENATPELLESLGAASRAAGARVVAQRGARTDLETFFLEVTRHRE